MSTTPTIRLSEPAELVAVLPFLLGYHPRDALVLVCARGARVVLTACQTLPEEQAVYPALDELMSGIAHADPDTAIVIAYQGAIDVQAAVEAATTACREVGIHVSDRIIVGDGTWQSLEHGSSGHTAPSSAVSELVGAGISPLTSRSDVDAILEPRQEAQDVARHLNRYTARENCEEALLALYCSAWPVVLDVTDHAPPITPKTAARAVLALRDIPVRDVLVARLPPGALHPADVPGRTADLIRSLPLAPWETTEGWERVQVHSRLQHRLVTLAGLTPDSHAAPPLTVLACWAWWRGDGALARAATERALRCDAGYRLAQLIQSAHHPQRAPARRLTHRRTRPAPL